MLDSRSMTTRRKSRAEHDTLFLDESARAADRASAIYALALDGARHFEADFAKLTLHPRGPIRGRAMHALLMWGRTDLLVLAEHSLTSDEDGLARMYVMLGLTRYVDAHPEDRPRVLRALARSVRADDSQRRCAYESFLQVLEPGVHGPLLTLDPGEVDWALVDRYAVDEGG